MKTIKIKDWLSQWKDYIYKATEILSQQDCLVEFEFNGVTVTLGKNTDVDLLWRDLENAHTMGFKTIGPYCRAELSKEELNALKARKKQLKAESDERERQWKMNDEKQQKDFNDKVGQSTLLVIDNKVWMQYIEKNQDSYGKCCVDYAKDWGSTVKNLENGTTKNIITKVTESLTLLF